MKPSIIVVEGRHDEARLHQVFPDVKTVSINGREIDLKVVSFLKSIEDEYEIIIFTDPDYAGEKIRSELTRQLKQVTHAFLPQSKAHSTNMKKIGIEHAKSSDIKKALEKRIVKRELSSDITISFLYKVGLIGHPNSNERRNQLATKLNLGNVNGKLLCQRLIYLGLNCIDVEQILDETSS